MPVLLADNVSQESFPGSPDYCMWFNTSITLLATRSDGCFQNGELRKDGSPDHLHLFLKDMVATSRLH